MNAEFLVASLWAVVVVYWFWSRRGTGGDSIGSFRRELLVLEHTAPTRVSPAHRLCPRNEALAGLGAVVSQPAVSSEVAAGPLVVKEPARQYRQAVMRRRRLRVLGALSLTVLVSMVAAVATMSMALVALQLAADAALAGYVALLARSRSRSTSPATLGHLARPRAAPPLAARPPTASPSATPTPAAVPVPAPPRAVATALALAPSGDEVDEDIYLDGYQGAHTLGLARVTRLRRAVVFDGDLEPYGDFASYASLAYAQAN